MEKEIWKTIDGFDGIYEISNHGRIKKIVKERINNKGYPHVRFCLKGHKTINSTIHSVVAEYFIGQRPEGCDIDHKDGNKINNHVDNLEYVSTAENMQRASRNGLMAKGSANGKSKINEEQVIEIRKIAKTHRFSFEDIGKIYNISGHQIGEIVRRKCWKHI